MVMSMSNNPVLAIINNDSEDAFIRDVVEAYFANPAHVRNLLTEDCIESCLGAYMRNQDVIADVRDLSSDSDNEAELSRKQRRAARRTQNARHKVSDRKHGKHARDVRKAIWNETADWDNMPNGTYYRWDDKKKTFFHSHKKPKVHRVKRTFRDRMDAATRDRLNDVSEIDRLTASVLAEVKQYHGCVGGTWNVFYLTEAICQREQLPYPDSVYVDGKTMVLGYFESSDDEGHSYYKYVNIDLA